MNLICSLFLLLLPNNVYFIYPDNNIQKKDLTDFEAYVDEALKTWGVPGVAIGIVDKNGIKYITKGVRKKGEKDPITTNTRFLTASLTKHVTAMIAAKLVDLGYLNWDDPIKKYLPDFELADPEATETLTIRHVLSHRTGAPPFVDESFLKLNFSKKEIWDVIKQIPLKHKVGKEYGYQNAFYGLMGDVFLKATGKDIQTLAQEYIFGPLNIKSASFNKPFTKPFLSGCHNGYIWPKNYSYLHQFNNGIHPLLPSDQYYVHQSSMGLTMDIEDAVKLLQYNMQGGIDILSDKQLLALHTPYSFYSPQKDHFQFPEERIKQFGYCMGWFMANYGTKQKNTEIYFHMGAWSGVRSYMVYIPELKIGIVILSNLGSFVDSFFPEALSFRFLDMVLGLKEINWSKKIHTEIMKNRTEYKKGIERERFLSIERKDDESTLVGKYHHDEYGVLEIAVKNNQLMFQYRGSWVPLIHRAGNTYDFDPYFLSQAYSSNEPGFIQIGYMAGSNQRALSCNLMGKGNSPVFLKMD